MAQGFLLFFLCEPLSHIHLRINISQRVKVITSISTWYHRSAKEHIPLKFQLYSSFKTQRRNDCTKSGSRVLTFPYFGPQILFYAIWDKGFLDHAHLIDGMQWQKKLKKHIYSIS